MRNPEDKLLRWLAVSVTAMVSIPLFAGVLPDDRADALYHSYSGGGLDVNGPSILIRKQVGSSVSISGNYYVDSISSASIDVLTNASPYKEERTEMSADVTYLHEKTTMGLGYTVSTENDFDARSAHFSFSQDIFGDLTTVSMGFGRGWDTVGKTGDPSFSQDTDRYSYSVGLSQVLTKNMLLDIGLQIITDEGFLNNPYRTVRFCEPTDCSAYQFQLERYPNTRSSHALAFRTKYYLEYHAAIHGEYRFFRDTWGIRANTFEFTYTQPLKTKWTLDVRFRYYQQSQADFYSDLFPRRDAQNYLARDKELSTFQSTTIGFGVSYDFIDNGWKWIDSGSINLAWDLMMFQYDNFRDLTRGGTVGNEPLYSFNADVVQLFFSIWY